MKIEITRDRILEAASKCSQAKETLKTLFPEVFENNGFGRQIINEFGSTMVGCEIKLKDSCVVVPLPMANTTWTFKAYDYVKKVIEKYPRCYPEHKNDNAIYINFSSYEK